MINPSRVCEHGSLRRACALCDALEELAELRPKTAAERQDKLRQTRAAQGLKRLELYAHPDDWPRIRAYAEKLTRKRIVKMDLPS